MRFLESSIFIQWTWNLKRIYISSRWIQPPIVLEVNVDLKSTTKVVLLKSTNFIWLTWNLKRIYISGHWIQPPIIFEVKFVFWISQLSCFAWCLIVYLFCAWYLKKLWTDPDKTWWTCWVCGKAEFISILMKIPIQIWIREL